MPESSPIALATLVDYLDRLLDAGRGRDVCPNGLQVEGRHQVERLVTGVSACRELFETARDRQADAVLVLSFPNGAAVDGFLRDPLRSETDTEELAARAVSRSRITDARHQAEPDDHPADVLEIRAPDGDSDR